jgi:hypothetical protein
MKLLLIINLIIPLCLGGYFYVGPDNGYSILLPENMKLVQVDTLEGGILNHTFVGKNEIEDFDFSLSLSVVESEIRNLILKENISKYEEDCNCKVENSERIEFPNFRGVKYTISKKIQDVSLAGEVYISEGINGKSINVVSMSIFEKGQHITKTISPILETLVLNF